MKKYLWAIILIILSFADTTYVFGQEYEALKGLKSIKAVFEFRKDDPKSAAFYLNAIYQTFKDKNITAVTEDPDFVVVFTGPGVKILSKNKEGFPPEEHEIIDKIADIISAMVKDGIKMEICLVASNIHGVDPESVLPDIKHVYNGWISLIGYQNNGYSLIVTY